MRSIKIYYPNETTGSLEMKFKLAMPEQITGVSLLLEKIAKLLKTKLQSNVFSPTYGCTIGDKKTLTFSNPMEIELAAEISVRAVQDLIISEQANQLSLVDEQQLDKLEISQIFKSEEDPTLWHIEVLVYTISNQTFFLTV